jgi:hypothetical protein
MAPARAEIGGLDIGALCESVELVLDLVRKLASVAHDEDMDVAVRLLLHLLQYS